MPIRPDQRPLYPPDWPQISHATKEAAGWRCEECSVPHWAWGWRDERGDFHDEGRERLRAQGYRPGMAFYAENAERRLIEIVLTVAHLDHDPTNNAPENRRALCQRCHLRHDAPHHRRNAAATRRRAMNTLDLLDQIA